MADYVSPEQFFIEGERQRVREILVAQIEEAKDALAAAEVAGDAEAAEAARAVIARAEAELKPLQRGG